MENFTAVIFDLVQDQHPSKIKSLSTKIRATTVSNSASLKGYFSTETANRFLDIVINEWERVGCSGDELAGLLTGVSIGYLTERERERVDFVWTGPDLNQFPVRRSEQVLLDVINQANESLFIVSFVLVNVPSIESAIEKAVVRGVDVRMLIESEDKQNTSEFRETVARIYDSIPGIILYVWPRDKREAIGGGFARVHAKCAVADQKMAFVTSANLTSAALDKNIEMGVHITGGMIPLRIYRQLSGMVTSKEIIPYAVNRVIEEPASKEKKSISLAELPKALHETESAIVQFRNEKLNIEETRIFTRFSPGQGKPKANSVIAIERDSEVIVGKYSWTHQQDMNDTENTFYLMSIRGFLPTINFKLTEAEWEAFSPFAVEVTK